MNTLFIRVYFDLGVTQYLVICTFLKLSNVDLRYKGIDHLFISLQRLSESHGGCNWSEIISQLHEGNVWLVAVTHDFFLEGNQLPRMEVWSVRVKYRRVTEFEPQDLAVGAVLHLTDGYRHLFYLVTNKWIYEKPTYWNIR